MIRKSQFHTENRKQLKIAVQQKYIGENIASCLKEKTAAKICVASCHEFTAPITYLLEIEDLFLGHIKCYKLGKMRRML